MVKNGKTKRKYHKPTKPQHQSDPPAAEGKNPITVKTLPAHLLLEILYRTPVKSLVRCKSVSKSWFALINHPTFIKMHLDFNSSRNDKDKQLICSCGNGISQSHRIIALLSLSQDPMPVLNIDKHYTERPNYPRKINFRDFSKGMVLAGSVNGIVCLSHYEEMSERFVALWNPGIHYWNPIPLVESNCWLDVSVGLGFDAVTNDYKIICIVPQPRFEDFGWSRIEIYSANQGSWDDKKDIIHFRPNADLHHCNFIVKGVPYWAGVDVQPGYVDVLGRIDPCTGLFKKIVHPKHVRNNSTRVNPVNLRDSVAALIQSPGELPNHGIDLYLLDENTSKWTKMYSIGPLVFDRVFERMRIPQCLSTGEIVLETWTRGTGDDYVTNLVRYFCDPITNILLRNNQIEALHPSWFDSYSHVESLVCVKGMVPVGKEHRDRKTNPKMKNWYLQSRALILLCVDTVLYECYLSDCSQRAEWFELYRAYCNSVTR